MGPQDFVSAIKSVPGMTTPTSSIPEVANFFRSRFQGAVSGRGGNALGSWAAQTADDEEEARKRAAQERIQSLQDQMDPSKYKQLRKDDGGFAFYSPDGKEIDIDTYAKRTGQRRVDVLSDSENPIDQQYIHDWKNMNAVAQAVWNNDQMTLNAVKDMMGLQDVRPEELMQRLMQQYPHMYGRGKYQDTLKNWGKPLFQFDIGDPTTWSASGGGGEFNL